MKEAQKMQRGGAIVNCAFCTHVKAGVGTKKWWILCMAGEQEFESHELEQMGSNGAEFGVVPGQSDQESRAKIC